MNQLHIRSTSTQLQKAIIDTDEILRRLISIRKVTVCWIRPSISTKQPWLTSTNWLRKGAGLCSAARRGVTVPGSSVCPWGARLFHMLVQGQQGSCGQSSLLWLPLLWLQRSLGRPSAVPSLQFSRQKTGEDRSLAKSNDQGAQAMPFLIIMPFLSFFMKYCWGLTVLLFFGIWPCSLGCRWQCGFIGSRTIPFWEPAAFGPGWNLMLLLLFSGSRLSKVCCADEEIWSFCVSALSLYLLQRSFLCSEFRRWNAAGALPEYTCVSLIYFLYMQTLSEHVPASGHENLRSSCSCFVCLFV